MSSNYMGFIGDLNQLVQEHFTDVKLNYDPAEWGSSDAGKYSYLYSSLVNTKGPDLIKYANLQNYLQEWERTYTYGGWMRSVAIGKVRPVDPPSFANGSNPNNGGIYKADVQASYHPFTIRSEFIVTNFASQLKAAMSVPDEVAIFLAGVLQAQTDGANDTLYRLYKELIYKYYSELSAANKTALSNDDIPATIESKEDAIKAINIIRNYVTSFMFGKDQYNSLGFLHAVVPARQRLYLVDSFANSLVDYLKLDHYMGDVNYADIAGSVSSYLGIPVKLLDDLGGMIPVDAEGGQLFPMFDAEGAVTGTYASAENGTTAVDVASWKQRTGYDFRALLTEDDFGNVFPINDSINTQNFIRGGGYVNTSRYVERICVANPRSNTIFFA